MRLPHPDGSFWASGRRYTPPFRPSTSVRVSGIGFSHQLVIAIFGGTAPLIAAAFVGAGHPMWVAIYMVVIVALCLIVYFTLPETGSKTLRATVALEDSEVVEGELKEAAVGARTGHSLS